jgi:hypothetical protein
MSEKDLASQRVSESASQPRRRRENATVVVAFCAAGVLAEVLLYFQCSWAGWVGTPKIPAALPEMSGSCHWAPCALSSTDLTGRSVQESKVREVQ